MNDELLKYQIGITLLKGIGPTLAKNLIAYLGSVEAVFKEKKQNLAKIPGIGTVLSEEIVAQDVLQRAEQEVEFVRKNKLNALFYTDKAYPYRLKECADSPVIIYYKGNQNLNDGKFVSVVGTRKATEGGREICKKLVTDLALKVPNLVIVSGLAYGIDICSHRAALDAGVPTIAALAHGLDRIYPGAHRGTAIKMLGQGGLITDFMSETNPDRQNFVQRNRIIAGMSDALIVVESAARGGALISAEMAFDYNRDVFAVPGRPDDTLSVGCNRLIKQNKAALIESADDVIRFMNWETKKKHAGHVQTILFEDLSDEEQMIMAAIRREEEGINVNELTVALNLPFSKLSSRLLEMEFKGLVKCLPGGMYRVVK